MTSGVAVLGQKYDNLSRSHIMTRNRNSSLLFQSTTPVKMGTTECTTVFQQPSEPKTYDVTYDVTISQISEQAPNPLQSHFQLKQPMVVKTLTQVNDSSRAQPNKQSRIQTPLPLQVPVYPQTDLQQQKKQTLKVNREVGRLSTRAHGWKEISINMEDLMTVREEKIEKFYEMKEKIGEGSYGQVYRAICLNSKEERAIKVLKSKSLKDSQQKNDFLREMTLLSKLNHPAIIKLYDLFHFRGKYFVVMEYCRGGAIVDILRDCKKKSEKIVANIMKQLLGALAYMHSLHIVHRDIKLDNVVFLNKVENLEIGQYIPIKIIDFGTAIQCKHRSIHGFPVTGTLSYLAPEVLSKTLTPKSDIWSSAVFMHILLTGTSPFKEKNQSVTTRNIIKKNLNFSAPPYTTKMSNEARELLEMMFNRNYRERISAKDALKHSWFTADSHKIEFSHKYLERLENYERGSNLLVVIQTYLCMRRINQDERQHYAELFRRLDTDGNGLIEVEELRAAYKQNGGIIEERETQLILNEIDGDHSGKVDFNQFLMAMYSRQKLFHRQALAQAFQYFDRDKTGYLQREEIVSLMKGSEKAEIECILAELDTDGDDRISKDEFIDYLMTEMIQSKTKTELTDA